ncbi:MAG TPA: hypothetical protein VH044_10470, partial [Polyangiaceae bacterium]|nr:hypothetical protein [Polyangiaceae bacterium]
ALRAQGSTALAGALAALVDTGDRRALLLTTIDGESADKTLLSSALHAAGFRVSREGWQRRRSESAAIPSRWSGRDDARAAATEPDDEPHA